jgi:hypothetical protein
MVAELHPSLLYPFNCVNSSSLLTIESVYRFNFSRAMPPKKRTSTVANADATEPSSKRSRKPAASETAAASRPKRFPQLPPRAAKTKAAAPAPKPSPAKRAAFTAKAQAQETPRKRGRPPATGATPAVKKGNNPHARWFFHQD